MPATKVLTPATEEINNSNNTSSRQRHLISQQQHLITKGNRGAIVDDDKGFEVWRCLGF